jgi:hypothetical protein
MESKPMMNRQSPYNEESVKMDNNIDLLWDRIKELETRLTPILGNANTGVLKEESIDKPNINSSIVNWMKDKNKRLSEAIMKLSYFLEKMEI